MMIEKNKSRVDDFSNKNEHREMSHGRKLKKRETNTILITINANGFRVNNEEKIDQIIKNFKINKEDAAILSEENSK